MDSQRMLMCIPLPDHGTLTALVEYRKLLLSLINRRIVSFTTIGGNTDYLCNSSMEQVMIKNEISSIINSIVIKIPFFSVYAGVIISSMLIKLWPEVIENYGLLKLTENLINFKNILEEALNSLKIPSAKVLNIASLQNSLKKLLLQEPALLLSVESLNKLSFEIVKGIFSKVDDNGFNIGHIFVHVRNGHEYFAMINGVVCEVDDQISNMLINSILKLGIQNKMLMFTESLYESDKFILIFNEILGNEIKLVMCQKKISDSLKVIFRRNNILAVERVGLDVAKSIEQITNCVPIHNINDTDIKSILAFAGFFSTLGLQNLNGLNYLVIENKGCSVSTLYVSCMSFSSSSYTKKICSSSIKFVYSMVAARYLLPGPISFEEQLIYHLKNNVICSDIMAEIVAEFCNTLNVIKKTFRDSNCEYDCSHEIFGISDWDCYDAKKNALIYSLDWVINCLSIGMIMRM